MNRLNRLTTPRGHARTALIGSLGASREMCRVLPLAVTHTQGCTLQSNLFLVFSSSFTLRTLFFLLFSPFLLSRSGLPPSSPLQFHLFSFLFCFEFPEGLYPEVVYGEEILKRVLELLAVTG